MSVEIGKALQFVHLLFGVGLALLTIFGPAKFLPYLVAFWILMLASFFVFSGCIVTRIERWLTGKNESVVDPFLYIAGVERTSRWKCISFRHAADSFLLNRNRNAFTVAYGGLLLLIALLRMKNFI